MAPEPFKFYYRACLLLVLIFCMPLSLCLIYRIYKIFIGKQPAIYPDCENTGLKIGKVLLFCSKLFVILFAAVLIGTIFLFFTTSPGGLSGVPAAMAFSLIPLFLFPSIAFIELSQINHRRLNSGNGANNL